MTSRTLVEAGFGAVTLGLGVALLAVHRRDRSMWLLGLAMLATAGTCDPRANTAEHVLLHSAAMASFALALLCYPAARGRRLTPGHDQFLTAGGGAAVLGATAARVLPPALSCAVLFGAALPAVGLVLLRHRGRDDLTAAERTQVRLLSGVLAGAIAIGAVLLLVTVPVRGAGMAPLFWFSRLVPVALASGALAAARRERLHAVQRRFSLGLVVVPVAVLAGGLFVALHTVIDRLAVPAVLVAPVAALPAALLLHPVHVRAERWVDRLLHGPRPTPYSVLAGIGSESLAGAADLARLAEAVGRGLGARVCRLTVHRPDRPDRVYAWTEAGAGEGEAVLTVPVVRGGEQLGAITVDLNAHRLRLVEDVADSLGPVLEANRLGVELERQLRAVRAHAADIAGSRRRLVAAMDAERRRIERDLHDGAQHHLVTLRLSLGLAEHRLATGRIEDAVAALDRVTGQIDDAETILARTATGVTSPLLVREGLVAALESELAVPVTASGLAPGRRFPADVEAAVWFCCLEAVNNARKHAPGAPIRLRLACGDQRLEFGIHDDGPGWDMDAGAGALGRGMRNVTARVTALGGQISVRSAPGAGTRVDGWVPLPDDGQPLVAAVREVVREALARHGDDPVAITQVGAGFDQLVAPDAAGARPPRRTVIRAAGSALRALDVLLRDDPALRHRLDRIRSGAHELAEIDAIDALRSGDFPGDVSFAAAARLLGDHGADAYSRLGLSGDAGPQVVAAAAERALAEWRARASHPGTAPGVRVIAATVVRSCEQLLAAAQPQRTGP